MRRSWRSRPAATPECKDDIIKQLGLRDPLVQIESFVRPNLRYSVLQRPSDRMGALAEVVSGHEGRGPAVVYCESRDEVVELARLLRAEGLEARALSRRDGGGGASSA